jgi:Ran GTPase-activating protein (RanGAP) involved in mRNA processing and transport
VRDSGLKALGNLRIHYLDLSGTGITNAGLEYLTGLRELQVIDLAATKVTDRGVSTLQQALPNCEIER